MRIAIAVGIHTLHVDDASGGDPAAATPAGQRAGRSGGAGGGGFVSATVAVGGFSASSPHPHARAVARADATRSRLMCTQES